MVSMTFFRYGGWGQRWWAFKQMALAPALLGQVDGLVFFKLLGSGGKHGFSLVPNWGVYGLLCVWQNATAAHTFFNHHPVFGAFKAQSISDQHYCLQPLSSHGHWDGQEPFANPKLKTEGQIAVITRAKIRWKKLWHFWRFVRPASQGLEDKPGLIFSIGIGELPLVQQATFSVWENTEKMIQYAYKSPQHKQVIQKTRELGWYSEELFARFAVLESAETKK